MFPTTLSRETLTYSENKIHCSSRHPSLSVKYCHEQSALLYRGSHNDNDNNDDNYSNFNLNKNFNDSNF